MGYWQNEKVTVHDVLTVVDSELNTYDYQRKHAIKDDLGRGILQAKIEALNVLRKRITRELLGEP